MKFIILSFLSLLLILSACQTQFQGCPEDARVCDDGSVVVRTGPNCEFQECPEVSEDEPVDEPVEPVPCTLDVKECSDGSFVGRVGPNCEFEECPEPVEQEVPDGPEEVFCTQDVKECDDGSFVSRVPPSCDFEDCPRRTKCTPESRLVEVCSRAFLPVCGWFSPQVDCISEPCASTFGNECEACRDSSVESFTEGECPSR